MTFHSVPGGRLCVRKRCHKMGACQYTHACKSMTPEEAVAASQRWEAARLEREALAREQAEADRRDKVLRLGPVYQQLQALSIDLDDLIELIDARRSGEF